MNILIANKDNIRCNEIKALAQKLNEKHNVTIVSMALDSAHKGLAFSFKDAPVRVSPILYKEVVKNASWVATRDMASVKNQSKVKLSVFDNIAAYEFFSNPADAVSIMLSEIMLTERPDLVICGINNGIHMGQDVYCSSNIGMAMEASFFKIPTIAVGTDWLPGGHNEQQLENAVKFIDKNIEQFAALKLPPLTFLNINIPTAEKYSQIKGVKITSMGQLTQLSEFDEKTDSKGSKYYWAKRTERYNAINEQTDNSARTWYDRGYITITPLSYDATDFDAVDHWEKNVVKRLKETAEELPAPAAEKEENYENTSGK